MDEFDQCEDHKGRYLLAGRDRLKPNKVSLFKFIEIFNHFSKIYRWEHLNFEEKQKLAKRGFVVKGITFIVVK